MRVCAGNSRYRALQSWLAGLHLKTQENKLRMALLRRILPAGGSTRRLAPLECFRSIFYACGSGTRTQLSCRKLSPTDGFFPRQPSVTEYMYDCHLLNTNKSSERLLIELRLRRALSVEKDNRLSFSTSCHSIVLRYRRVADDRRVSVHFLKPSTSNCKSTVNHSTRPI